MTKVRTWVGLDEHAEGGGVRGRRRVGEMTVHRLPGLTTEVVAFCAAFAGAGARVCSGPDGVWPLARAAGGGGGVRDRGAGED
ncbi:MAG: hypothetical protein WAK93_01810 [Solirubrobacteraceae bacterium]